MRWIYLIKGNYKQPKLADILIIRGCVLLMIMCASMLGPIILTAEISSEYLRYIQTYDKYQDIGTANEMHVAHFSEGELLSRHCKGMQLCSTAELFC